MQRADGMARELRVAVDRAFDAGSDLIALGDAQEIGTEVGRALELAAELARDLGIWLASAGQVPGSDRLRLRNALDDAQVLIGDLDDALALNRDLGRLLERALYTEFARSRAPVFARELVYAIARALDSDALGLSVEALR